MKKASPDKLTARKMWLGVAAGFLVLAMAWTAMFVAARRADVASVPLSNGGGGTR